MNMASSKRKNYYAIAGANGFGAYSDYNKVEISRKFLKNFRCKGCKTFEEAKQTAINIYHEIRGTVPETGEANKITSMNWCYRTDI